MNIELLDKFLDEIYELNDIPGISVGVSVGSSFVYRGVRGYRDYDARTPLSTDDIFHCASVSKLFTSSAIMDLVRKGRIGLDDRLCQLLPDLPFEDERIGDVRLWNMLTHTSGIGDCPDYKWYDPDLKPDAIRRYCYSDEVCKQPMLWEPQNRPQDADNRFRYSNVAYEILGLIAAEYGGMEYEDLIAALFFKPLGMSASSMRTFSRPDWGTDVIARPHEKLDDRSIALVKDYPYNPSHAPSSTLTTNTGDLIRWGKYHLENASSFNDAWSEYATVPNNGEKMGLGWFIRKQTINGSDYTLYGHEGTDDGFRASFWICPDLQVTTVVLSNLSAAPVKKINKQMFALVADNL